MRSAGGGSWRFAHNIDQSLHNALYVRDSLGLEIAGLDSNPPRLAGEIPDHSSLLDADGTRAAAVRWPAWWQSVVAVMAAEQLGQRSDSDGSGARPPSPENMRRRAEEGLERIKRVVDPPEWTSLADSPALREAVQTLWTESCRWFAPARLPHLPPTRTDVFEWHAVRDGAKRAAAAHRVSPSAIDGCAEVLLVEGIWWRLAAPGAVLCSIGAATDPDTVPDMLDAVFGSHLAA